MISQILPTLKELDQGLDLVGVPAIYLLLFHRWDHLMEFLGLLVLADLVVAQP